MALGSPAIPDPRALELRPVQAAIAAARQRIEALERSLAGTAALAGQTAYTGGSGGGSAAVTALQNSLTQLAATVSAIQDITDALTAVSGLVAMVGGVPTGRTLVAGDNVTIANADGVAGNPTISATGGSGGGSRGEFILTEDDDFLQTESGLHLVVE